MPISRLLTINESLNLLMRSRVVSTIGYDLAMLVNQIREHLQAYAETEHNTYLQYGRVVGRAENGQWKYDFHKKTESGEPYNKEETRNAMTCQKELADLQNKEIDIKDVPEIKISDLVTSDGKQIDIEPQVFVELAWLIKK